MGAPSNRTPPLESQMIPMIQDVPGQTLRDIWRPRLPEAIHGHHGHAVRALAYPVTQVATSHAPHERFQEGYERASALANARLRFLSDRLVYGPSHPRRYARIVSRRKRPIRR